MQQAANYTFVSRDLLQPGKIRNVFGRWGEREGNDPSPSAEGGPRSSAAALPMAPGVGAQQRLRPRAACVRVPRSDSDESPAQLLICVNQTTFKGAFVRSLEHQARAGASSGSSPSRVRRSGLRLLRGESLWFEGEVGSCCSSPSSPLPLDAGCINSSWNAQIWACLSRD